MDTQALQQRTTRALARDHQHAMMRVLAIRTGQYLYGLQGQERADWTAHTARWVVASR